MRPSIGDLVGTMRAAIAMATEPATPLLENIELGLQAIVALAGDDAGGRDFDLSSVPRPMVVAGDSLPQPGGGAFEDYLRDRIGKADLRLEAVARISGGFSRDMIRLRVAIDGGTRDIVVRREVPGGLLDGIGIDVAGEYPPMEIARRGGVPMAAPLWLETDPAILGQPFIAMDCAAGVCLGTSLGAAGAIGQPQLRALAAMLARLHRADWRALPLPPGTGSGSAAAATALLDRWSAYRGLTTMPPTPLLDEAMRWLREYLPADGLPPCLTHGDVGFHNVMADAHGFTALLDWEMAAVASPAKDMAHIRPSIEHMVGWETFTGWYRDAGGARIAPAELRWFEIFRAFSMTLVCHVALAKLADPTAARIEYFRLGFVALPVFSAQLATLLTRSP